MPSVDRLYLCDDPGCADACRGRSHSLAGAPVAAGAVSSEVFAPGLGPLVLLIEAEHAARLCSRVRRRVDDVGGAATGWVGRRRWRAGSQPRLEWRRD